MLQLNSFNLTAQIKNATPKFIEVVKSYTELFEISSNSFVYIFLSNQASNIEIIFVFNLPFWTKQ